MTTEQITDQIVAIHTVTEQLLRSKETATDFLVAAGILTSQEGTDLKIKFQKEKSN